MKKIVENNTAKELLIYKKTEMLFNRIYPALKNFPKSEKYSLCDHIKNDFLELLKYITLANNVKSKRKTYE